MIILSKISGPEVLIGLSFLMFIASLVCQVICELDSRFEDCRNKQDKDVASTFRKGFSCCLGLGLLLDLLNSDGRLGVSRVIQVAHTQLSSPCEDLVYLYFPHILKQILRNPSLRCLWWELPPLAGLRF